MRCTTLTPIQPRHAKPSLQLIAAPNDRDRNPKLPFYRRAPTLPPIGLPRPSPLTPNPVQSIMSAPRALRSLARPASTLLRAAPLARAATPIAARGFSQSLAKRGGGGDHHYDAPSGWLFGVKPGEKYEKEGWENVTFYVFIPMMVIFVGVYAFKPDTR